MAITPTYTPTVDCSAFYGHGAPIGCNCVVLRVLDNSSMMDSR